MLKLLTISLLLFFTPLLKLSCQTLAITEVGDTVFLYDNGTWSYEYMDEMPTFNELNFLELPIEVDTIEQSFKVPANVNKEVNSNKDQFKIKYNNKLWKRVPSATLNNDAEFAFESKTEDIWSIVISETSVIPQESLFKIAKNLMEEKTGGTAQIMKTELRNINDTEILRGVLKITFSGITFIFDSYYYSDDLGSVQFTVWTSENLWKNQEPEILDFLNGFIVNKQ
jgi:hypothetical protein